VLIVSVVFQYYTCILRKFCDWGSVTGRSRFLSSLLRSDSLRQPAAGHDYVISGDSRLARFQSVISDNYRLDAICSSLQTIMSLSVALSAEELGMYG
jgi:hypothetical protein